MNRRLLLVAKANRAAKAPRGTRRIPSPSRGSLELRMFDVGDGEAILIQFPGKTAWLVDGGSSNSSNLNSLLADALADYLKRRRLRLRALVASHPHKDHAGALADLVPGLPGSPWPVSYYYTYGAKEFPDKWLVALETSLKALGNKIRWRQIKNDHEHVHVGEKAEVHLFAGAGAGKYTSVFMHVRFGEASLLFTGDALAAYEGRLLKTYGEDHFRADVLKLTHHGASSGTSAAFVTAVKPAIVIASTASDEGHRLEPDVWSSKPGEGRLGPPRRKFETLRDGDIILRTTGEARAGGVLYQVETRYPGLLTKGLEAAGEA